MAEQTDEILKNHIESKQEKPTEKAQCADTPRSNGSENKKSQGTETEIPNKKAIIKSHSQIVANFLKSYEKKPIKFLVNGLFDVLLLIFGLLLLSHSFDSAGRTVPVISMFSIFFPLGGGIWFVWALSRWVKRIAFNSQIAKLNPQSIAISINHLSAITFCRRHTQFN